MPLVDRDPWRWQNMDQDRIREASVLVLFGPREAAPPHQWPEDAAPEELDVLVLVRAATLNSHAGQPAFPGGKVDPEDRTAPDPAVEAALREAVEETGLDRRGVEVLGTLPPVPLPVSNFVVTPVLGWWTRPSAVAVVDRAESAQVFRVPVAQLVDPAHRHQATVTRGRTTHRTPAFTVESPEGAVTIWGFTGILLDQLLERAGWAQDWDHQDQRPVPGA